MARLGRSALVTAGLLLFASPALAQQPQQTPAPPPPAEEKVGGARTHDGFYMRLGGGLGYMSTTEEIGAQSAKIKGMGSSFLGSWGGSPIPGLAIAGSLFMHVQSKPTFETGGISGESNNSVFLLTLGPTVDFFPDPKGGFHVGTHLHYSSLNAINYTSTGYAAGLFTGYDFFFSDSWSVGPTLQVMYSSTSKDPAKDSSLSTVLMVTLLDH